VEEFTLRPAAVGDARAMALLMAAVAQERRWIASEPPLDVDSRAATFRRIVATSVIAVASDQVIGIINVEVSRHGFGDIGMLVDRDWRGRGVGSALVQAAIDLARGIGLHKLSLEVFPHNPAAIALYRRSGFAVEGRRVRQYRRANGELWDSIMMGLLLQPASSASPVPPAG
jgi:RimJ/RimL family protein N-acetyltransferase